MDEGASPTTPGAESGGAAALETKRSPPTVHEACVSAPLYKVLVTGDEVPPFVRELRESFLRFDSYCPGCRKEATFERVTVASKALVQSTVRAITYDSEVPSTVRAVHLRCTRYGHPLIYFFGPYRGGIAKIGQTPSSADIAGGEMERFKGELDEIDMVELVHGLRMRDFNAAVAAFVYLRRIFERLLDRHRKAEEAANGPIDGYDTMRVAERVQALRARLPEEVVENRKIYGILSKGIHELSEEQCAAYHPVLFAVIVDILQQDVAARERARARAALRAEVDRIVGDLEE